MCYVLNELNELRNKASISSLRLWDYHSGRPFTNEFKLNFNQQISDRINEDGNNVLEDFLWYIKDTYNWVYNCKIVEDVIIITSKDDIIYSYENLDYNHNTIDDIEEVLKSVIKIDNDLTTLQQELNNLI